MFIYLLISHAMPPHCLSLQRFYVDWEKHVLCRLTEYVQRFFCTVRHALIHMEHLLDGQACSLGCPAFFLYVHPNGFPCRGTARNKQDSWSPTPSRKRQFCRPKAIVLAKFSRFEGWSKWSLDYGPNICIHIRHTERVGRQATYKQPPARSSKGHRRPAPVLFKAYEGRMTPQSKHRP